MAHRLTAVRRYTRRHFLGIMAGLSASLATGCGRDPQAAQSASATNAQPTPDQATAEPSPTTIDATPLQPTAVPQATATASPPTAQATASPTAAEGVLTARPVPAASGGETTGGVHALGLVEQRDALLYVPAGYQANGSTRLVLLLHGAGGIAEHGLSLLQSFADAANLLLLAPPSRRQTWDVILDEYGPDVAFIDRALSHTFKRYAVDPTRLAIGGFSDGASYALSLGLTNGDLFTHVMAFSPGYMTPSRLQGKPNIFITHGIRDDVLPIDRCSRRIVPQLQAANYEVRYHEFDGPHTVPPELAREGVEWFSAAS